MTRIKVFSVGIGDCRVECIASTGGAGGQNKNRRHTAVRITHPPSGAVGFSADERDQLRNKRTAWRRMADTKEFTLWARLEVSRRVTGKTIDEQVDELMAPENLKIEYRRGDKWTETDDELLVQRQDPRTTDA